MSSTAMASTSSVRPKIHRLPAPKPRRRLPRLPLTTPSLLWSALAVILIVASMANQKTADASRKAVESASLVPPAMAANLPITGPGRTIVLRSDSEMIVGQLARIPAETEQITEIKAVSDIDNDAGHELLSIISKY